MLERTPIKLLAQPRAIESGCVAMAMGAGLRVRLPLAGDSGPGYKPAASNCAFTVHTAPGECGSARRCSADRIREAKGGLLERAAAAPWRRGEAAARPGEPGRGNGCHRDLQARSRGAEGGQEGERVCWRCGEAWRGARCRGRAAEQWGGRNRAGLASQERAGDPCSTM